MREKNMNTGIDLLNLIMHYYVCFCIMTPIFYYFCKSHVYAVLFSASLLPAMLLSYLLRMKAEHVWTYITLHLCMIAVLILLPRTLIIKVTLLVFAVILSIVNLYYRISVPKHKKVNASPMLLLFPVASYMICTKFHINYLPDFILYGLLLCSLCYCYNCYLINYRNYFSTSIEKANVPMTQIRRICNLLMSGFLCLSGLLMLILCRLPLKQLFAKLNDLLYRFLRWLLSKVNAKPSPKLEDVPQEQVMQKDIPFSMLLKDEPKKSPIWDYLERIVLVLLSILLVIAAIAAIIGICYSIYKKFHAQQSNGIEKKEFISPFSIKKEKVKESGDHSPRSFFLFSTNRDKMRCHFYHLMKPRVNPEKVSFYTSQEMTHSLNKETNQLLPVKYPEADLTKLYRLYDKARYSNEECTKQEYQAMKKIRL